jgi:DNA-binding transcriptional ArsR family regulator
MVKTTLIDQVFQALAEPTRRAMVERLSQGPASVSELAKPFDVTLAAVMQHLSVLEQSGLVRSEKVGRVRTCRIDPAGFGLAEQWFQERRALWQRRFDRLASLLDDELDDDEAASMQPPSGKKGKKP